MKKLILLVLILAALHAKSQTALYFPFPEDSASWCASICGNQGNGYNKATYQLNGKVFINGNWYSSMHSYEKNCFGAGFCVCAALTSVDTTTHYIRQDVAQKKVWLYVPATNSDTIFLDFNLHVGDTIDYRKAYWAGQVSFSGIVSAVDSVLIGSHYRNRYRYDDQGFPNYLIEGIGPSHGFFYPSNHGYDYFPVLNLFVQQNQIFYPNYSADTSGMGQYCYNFTTGIQNLSPISFSISPNPAVEDFVISFAKAIKKGKIEILTIFGEPVFSEAIYNESKKKISLQKNSSGLYFVKVFDGEMTSCKKIIVEQD